MVCLAFGVKSDVKSFIANLVLQNKSHIALLAVVFAASMVGGAAGFWAGSDPGFGPVSGLSSAVKNLQSPMAIIPASAQQGESELSSSVPINPIPTNQVPTNQFSQTQFTQTQFTQTVGRLHADILTLRVLYRRLAEDAGIDLTDFALDAVIELPTEATDAGADTGADTGADADADAGAQGALEAVSDQVELIKESSSALSDWYERRSRERVFDLSGPVIMSGSVSSRFGWRKGPLTGEQQLHKGVDYSGLLGEPVLALADGVVSYEGQVNAYGNMVELLHANGLRTRYAHNDSNSVVVGQRVEQGQIIAKLGSTGRSTGPHVHVEVHLNGEAVDPMLYIQ